MDLQQAEKWLRLTDYLPRRHPLYSAQPNLSCNPYFVIGSGRNGSTLLSAMLDAHPDVLLPTEQWRFPTMILKYKAYNFLPWKELVSLIIGEIAASNANLNWFVNFNDTLATLQYLPREERSLQKILDEIYLAYAKKNEKKIKIWGEKSPRNMPFTPLLFQVYPKAKYIFLIRDGRDVARSWLVKNESKDLDWISHSWNESIAMYEWLQRKAQPGQLLMVKYEDLVSEPERILTGIGDFLGVGFHADMLRFQGFAERIGDDNIKHFEKLKTTPNQGSIGKWKKHFSPPEQQRLTHIMGSNLQKFGYQ